MELTIQTELATPQPCARVLKTVRENGLISCAPTNLRPLVPLRRCDNALAIFYPLLIKNTDGPRMNFGKARKGVNLVNNFYN